MIKYKRMTSQIRKNYVYNVIYQLLLLIMPLITIPYVSRILGADGVGIYSYTYSIAYYFVIIAMLGIENYGNRLIAKSGDDKEKVSNNFWSVYSLQFIMSIIMISAYLLYMIFIENRYSLISMIQLVYVLSVVFDINWFFFGKEQFRVTVTRNILIKIASVFLIFLCVKNRDNLWVYTLIMAGSTLLSQLVLWPFILKQVNPFRKSVITIKKHIKPCLVLFIPVIAVSLYKVMDKLMLGLMSDISEVGYYEQAEKLVNFPIAFITALGMVIMPRVSNLISTEKTEEAKIIIEKAITFMMFLACPMALGLIAVSSDFVPLYMGDAFMKSSIILSLLSATIVFVSFANVLRKGFMLPKEMDKEFVIFTIAGAIVNLIINLIFIPMLQSVGACIGTIVAEFVAMAMQVYYVRKELPVWEYIKKALVFLLKGLIMLAVVWPLKWFNLSSIQTVVAQVFVGAGLYFIMNYKYIGSVFSLRDIIVKIRG